MFENDNGKAIEKQKDIYICFIDYVKVFDTVKHQELIYVLEQIGIDEKTIIAKLYWNQMAAVRVENELGGWVPIQKGVRQGCVLSPDLFSLYIEKIMSTVQDLEGVQIGDMYINNLRYADDTALIADSNEKLQKILDRVVLESEKMGLGINCKKKTYSLPVSRRKCPDCKLSVKDKEIKQMDSFTYLGSIITSHERSETDIKYRIGMAKTALTGMGNVLCSKKLNIETRKRVLKCYVWSVLTYGSECWTISKNMAK